MSEGEQMSSDQFQQFMEDQCHQIEVDKWIEGERIHADPGPQYIQQWIQKNAKGYREMWIKTHPETNEG